MQKSQEKNQIKIGFNTRIGSVVTYSRALLDNDKFTTLSYSAIGGAIGSLVNVVEVLKTLYPKFHQITKISSVAHQTLDNTNNSVLNERLSPKLDVTLSFEKPTQTGEGYQEPYPEEVREKLKNKLDESRNKPREDTRGGRGFRGGERGTSRGRGFRGGRGRGFGGNSRGGNQFREEGERPQYRDDDRVQSRGGFRGERGQSRGGFRGERGTSRGFRGGERGQSRGGFRGERGQSRGGFRGERGQSRGGFRGERGQSRGGFRGGERGYNNESKY